jgi:mannose-1-phosphate guanylyltransferase
MPNERTRDPRISGADAKVYALILAGGAGTRFWPASRSKRPKQLLPLTGGDALLCETIQRVLPIVGGYDQVVVASGRHLAAPTAALLPELPHANLLVEPVPRNTAPCIGLAAARIAHVDPDAVVMVLPSDHHIGDPEAFQSVLRVAVAAARTGTVATIGVRPTHPETGYGYIEIRGDAAAGPVLAVERFVEKPDKARAVAFVESGRFLWNAGMFFFRAGVMMEALRNHQRAIWEGVQAIALAGPPGSEAEREALDRIFPDLTSVSIDHGVMEHLDALSVVPGEFGWSDIGSWQSAWELAQKDEKNNASPHGTVFVDAAGNHVVDLRPEPREGSIKKRVIALVGVKDLVVVETEDALLVVPRERSQDVKLIVEALKQRGDDELV